MRFSTSSFFHEYTPYSPRINTIKYFWILFRIRGNIRIYSCSPGSDTPQNFVPQGLIPRKTLLGGVSDPAGCCSAGYQTLKNKIMLQNIRISVLLLRGLIPHKTWFRGVWYPVESCSAGSDTSQDFILRGIRPYWQIKTPQNQTKKLWKLAILFKGTLFENCLHV
jgi:hypothetical protein